MNWPEACEALGSQVDLGLQRSGQDGNTKFGALTRDFPAGGSAQWMLVVAIRGSRGLVQLLDSKGLASLC